MEIQKELKSREINLFYKELKGPLCTFLEVWINKEYPSLVTDKADLIKGALRRMKNEIIQHDFFLSELNIEESCVKYIRIECESTLPNEKNIKKNLGLTKTAFKQMVSALKNGNEAIIETIYLAHFEKCVSTLIKQIKCSREVAYDSTLEALIEIRNDLLKNRILYGNLASYFITKAVHKFYQRERKKKVETLPIIDGMTYPDHIEDQDTLLENDLKNVVKKAIMKLGEECQFILKQFYYNDLNMYEIGIKMKKNHDAIRKQASRCRSKMKKYLGEKFYRQFTS